MIILTLSNVEAWKTVGEYIRSRKIRVTCLSDECKQASKIKIKSRRKIRCGLHWVRVGWSEIFQT